MQRLTIVADDSLVIVDGVGLKVDLTGLDPQIHAVQWKGTKGDVEWKEYDEDGNRHPNATITDVTPYQVFIDRWTAAKAAYDAAKAAKTVAAVAKPTPPVTGPKPNVIAS